MGIEVKCNINKNTDINELVRFFLLKNKMSIAELARQMAQYSGISYSRFTVRAKLERKALKFMEMVLICEILGYKIDLAEDIISD